MVRSGVAVEKLAFSEESRNLRDRKCLGDCEKSFLELPDAKHLCEFLMSEFFNSHRVLSTPIRKCLKFLDLISWRFEY